MFRTFGDFSSRFLACKNNRSNTIQFEKEGGFGSDEWDDVSQSIKVLTQEYRG
jgi:hypothetical protein